MVSFPALVLYSCHLKVVSWQKLVERKSVKLLYSILGGFSGSIGTIAMVIVQIPMMALGVILMDKSGRQPLLLVRRLRNLYCVMELNEKNLNSTIFIGFAAGTCLGCLLVGLSFFLQVYIGSFSPGMGGIPLVIMLELGSWIVSYAFNFLIDLRSAGTFFIFLSICGLTILFVAKLVPETKGRTLRN
ncbi:sugar transporter erd6-like 5 [Quercus suber]|uniref:Sugar transporter erd6-like 5 n=1 Tax=Quercus suber TaxID=58331 RepID=A0AAW0JUX8_QUESU